MTTLFPMSSLVSPGAQARAAMEKEMSEELPRIRKFLVSPDSSFSGSCSGFSYRLAKRKDGSGADLSLDFPSPYQIEIGHFPKGRNISYSIFGKIRRFIAETLNSGKIYLNFMLRTDNLQLAKSFCDRNTEYLEELLEEHGGPVKIMDGRISIFFPYLDRDISKDDYRSQVALGIEKSLETMVKVSKGED